MRQRKMKRIFAILLIFSMLASSNIYIRKAGAAPKAVAKEEKEVVFPLKKEKEYDVFALENMNRDLADNITMQKLLKDANLKFNFTSVNGTDLLEKRNLLISSGKYPDIFYKASFDDISLAKYGKQGVFIPLEKLIKKYMPNLAKTLDENNGWDYLSSSDGHIYSLPEISGGNGAVIPYWLNKKWLDNLGLQEPKSRDELYKVLKAFKDEDANKNGDPNDEIPFHTNTALKFDTALTWFGFCYDPATKTTVDNGKLKYIPTSAVYKEFLTFLTKLYKEGILDKSCFTDTIDQQTAKGQSGDKLGSFFDYGAYLTVGHDNNEDYVIMSPFEEDTFPLMSYVCPGGMTITDKCKNSEIICAWADRLYSEEGARMAWLGIEGETYKINDKGNWEWILGKHGDTIGDVRANATIQGGAYMPAGTTEFFNDNMDAASDPDEKALVKEREKIYDHGKIPLPAMKYSEDEYADISSLKTDIDAYIDQYLAHIVTGKESLKDSWDEYKSKLNDMGVQKLIKIYKKSYQKAVDK